MPGCRSSDFFCRVHLLVAVSTALRMSLAILRARLVIGLLRIVGDDDRRLAPIGVLDVRGCQMERANHRLLGIGAHLSQGALESFTGRSEAAKWITYRGAPVS